MEAQRQLMHVLEGHQREIAHRVHRHLGEHAVARLSGQRHHDAGQTIGDCPDHPGDNGPIGPRQIKWRTWLSGQRVGRPLEGERHRDGCELGDQQQRHGDRDPRF
jgi:hypothetical protein